MRDENQIEGEIQAKGLTAPRLTPAAIDAVIVSEQYHVFPGSTLTVCALTLRNGFVVTGESAAASAENFDADMGRVLARINARDKIWAFEGYLLRERLSKSGNDARAVDVATAVHANAETASGYYWTRSVNYPTAEPTLTLWKADLGLWFYMGISGTSDARDVVLASGRLDLSCPPASPPAGTIACAVPQVETVARENGISADTLNAIKAEILGVKPQTKAGNLDLNHATLRLKMSVGSVKSSCDIAGKKTSEEITLHAVHGPRGSPNAQWSKWTPSANMTIQINNPDAFGRVLPEQFYFVDLIQTDRDGL